MNSRKDRNRGTLKDGLFIAACAAAVLMAAGLIWVFTHTLVLRTHYKAMALAVNDVILASPAESVFISCGEDKLPANEDVVDYYNKFLLDRNTVVFNGRKAEETDKTITLTFPDASLSFTGLEDGSAINVHFVHGEEDLSYTVRSMMTFTHLTAYWTNYLRRAGG